MEVRCQEYREQSKNRLIAYRLLINKIEAMVKGRQSEQAKKRFKLIKQKKKRSKRAKEKMLKLKHERSEVKQNRKDVRV
jgi:protein subunit release factor A